MTNDRRSRAWAVRAAILVAVFLCAHLLGFRDHVSVLSGTEPAGGGTSATAGVFYVVAWLVAVVVAPIYAIAAALQFAASRILERRDPSPPRAL
jgi:uncharacterized membrane protein (DUF485 family)